MNQIYHGKLDSKGITITPINVLKITKQRVYTEKSDSWRDFIDVKKFDADNFERLSFPQSGHFYSGIEAYGKDKNSLRIKLISGLEKVRIKGIQEIEDRHKAIQEIDRLLTELKP